MPTEIEAKKATMQIMTTAQEKVLIKRRILDASKYEKNIIQYAKKGLIASTKALKKMKLYYIK